MNTASISTPATALFGGAGSNGAVLSGKRWPTAAWTGGPVMLSAPVGKDGTIGNDGTIGYVGSASVGHDVFVPVSVRAQQAAYGFAMTVMTANAATIAPATNRPPRGAPG